MFASPRRADAKRVFAEVLILKSLLGAAIAALLSFSVHTQTTEAGKTLVERDLGGDHSAAGCPVRVDKPVQGDVFLAGCSIDVEGAVDGDALVAGGTVRLGAPIGQSLYAAGGQLFVNANVARNARIAGGQVALGSRSQVAGNVVVAGGNVRIEGAVKGYVRAAGGRVLINGPVDGDVVATAGKVELGPNARIGGQLRYASREEIKRDAAAHVQGGVQRMQVPDQAERSVGRRGGWVWSIGLMLIAAALVGAFPGFYARVAETLRARGWMSLLLGFVALVCIPVAALIMMFTLIGVPLALLAIALYLALLLVGYVSTGIGLGAWVLARLKADRAEAKWRRIGAAVLGVLAISLLGRLPYAGGFVVFAALLIGLGAVRLQVRTRAAAG
jgi:cytoskeletal protein CcmA (bactofilin family)